MDEQKSCLICYSQYSMNNLYLFPICQHTYCKYCLNTKYEQNIREQKVMLKDYACAFCNTQLVNNQWIQNVVSQDYYSQYSELLIKQNLIESLKNDELFVGCKNQQCQAKFMIWKYADYQQCSTCKQQHCRKCNYDHQTNITCEEAQILKEGSYIEKKKKFKISRCPKCKTLVEKIAGCNFMTCQCGTYFCYECDSQLKKEVDYLSYQKDHHQHFQSNKCKTLLENKYINKKKIKILSIHDYIPCIFCGKITEPLIDKLIYQCKSEKCEQSCFCTQCYCKMKIDEIPYHLESQNCLLK